MSTSQALRRILFAALLCASLPAPAAFISDRIEVPVHAQKFAQGALLKTLISGAAIEVLMKDGQYARIRTSDNITGWIETRYLSEDKPSALEYVELLGKTKALEDELQATREKLAQANTAPAPLIDDTELQALRQEVKDARWMRVEMNKAREQAKSLETELKQLRKRAAQQADGASKANEESQAELQRLRTENQGLQDRLAAALLIGEQQAAPAEATPPVAPDPAPAASGGGDGAWAVDIEWLLGGLLASLVVGAIAGASWLDRRIRRRHGGFRVY